MGNWIEVNCRKCDYSKELRLGKGLLYDKISNYLVTSELTGKQMQNELLDVMEKRIFKQECEMRLFRCSKCGSIYARFYARVIHARGNYRTRHRCPRCNKYLDELMPGEVEEITCPRCREIALEYRIKGYWD